MAIFKSKLITKDGASWFYKVPYTDKNGVSKFKVSKKFLTKTEAIVAEKDFITNNETEEDYSNITFGVLVDKYLEYKKDKVKVSTYKAYEDKLKHLTCLYKIKCSDFNIRNYTAWQKKIKSHSFSVKYNNSLLKLLKAIMNFGTNEYDIDFSSIYRKMEKFYDLNGVKKQMQFYTPEEFKKFLSAEDDIKFRSLWIVLYYCGLRKGEVRGLKWNDINFENNTLSVNRQVTISHGLVETSYLITSPKTQSSIRTIPLCDPVINTLLDYKNYLVDKKIYSSSSFIFGDKDIPLFNSLLFSRKNKIADKSGVKRIRTHDFRHSCASVLINSGANVTIVAEFLGHTKIEETLNTYSHMYQSALKEVINIMNKLT